MPDAEIIPIGAKAAAGRGSRTSPTAAARALAPAASKPKPRSRRVAAKAGEPLSGVVADETPDPKPVPADDVTEAIADAAEEVFGESGWERRLAETLAFLRHRITGDYDVDEFGFDAEITERFVLAALRPIAEKWFRIEVRGIENIPVEGGALVVSNHSGALPMDGLMTALVLHDHAQRSLRILGADLVFTLPFIGELARKGGATLAGTEDAERMLGRGELVGVWPEGFKGIGKPFSERYKLQRFGRGGFVSAALRVKVPIIPCSVVGAEEIYPMVGNIPSLARLLGVPYIPITPFFPWLGPLGLVPLPSKWLIEFGEPIRTDSYGDGAADDPMLVFNVTDQVRETIQQTLYSLLMQRRGVFS
ncbi:MAG: acyltransferase family protein [Actinomycetota bacterium]|nr:acyltransferase family protein [Actinomycetota bacterium]